MNKFIKTLTVIGILLCLLPAAQNIFTTFDIPEAPTSILFAFLLMLLALPNIIFYFLIKRYFIEKAPSLWGQVAAGLLTILLYLTPIFTSLAWITDLDGFASSDGLNSIALITIPLILIGISIIPAAVLIFTSRKS